VGTTPKLPNERLKLTTFAAPPKDFNPLTASDKLLAVHGIPRRPDATQEPVLRNLWDKAFAKPMTFVQAQLVEEKIWKTVPHGIAKPANFGLAGNWAGGIVQVSSLGLNPPEPANVVFAEWVVPAINMNTKLSGSQTVGFWVGLGGWGTSQVLQAGTAATVNGNSVSYWAWTEWFPAGYQVANFPVQPGDTVSVLVCAPSPSQGYVSMMNHRTSLAISVGVADPNGTAAYDGSSVEWIIEAINTEMPNFEKVIFTQLNAGTQHHAIDLTHAFTANTVNGSTTLATGKILASQNEVEVLYGSSLLSKTPIKKVLEPIKKISG
jgi:hypothetical protein